MTSENANNTSSKIRKLIFNILGFILGFAFIIEGIVMFIIQDEMLYLISNVSAVIFGVSIIVLVLKK